MVIMVVIIPLGLRISHIVEQSNSMGRWYTSCIICSFLNQLSCNRKKRDGIICTCTRNGLVSTLLSLAGVRSEDLAVPGKPLDGVNMWEGLVNGKYDPGNGQRIEMLYELDDVVHPMGEAKFLTRATNAFVNVTTLRIGDWKLIDGYPGRGDWYGEDPSKAWPVDYIMGPDVTDYNAIPLSLGGKVGDGGQRDFLENGDTSNLNEGGYLIWQKIQQTA